MKSRKPPLDFTSSLPAWAPNREFAHLFNAISIIIMQLEPYLNKTAARIRARLDEDDPLRQELTTFIRQEATHTLLHRQYNETLYRAGYDGLRALEKEIAAEYARFLDEKSMLFNAGYAQGFEIVGPIYAQFIFEEVDDFVAGADQQVVDLWRWHLAEEYEHRMVAHEGYHRMGGNWFHRLWVTWTTLRHLAKYNLRAEQHLLGVDARTMTEQEQRHSRAMSRKVHRRLNLFVLRKVLPVLLPWYTPARCRTPRGVEHYLGMPAPVS